MSVCYSEYLSSEVSDRIYDVVERNLGRQQDIDIGRKRRRRRRQETRIMWQGDDDEDTGGHEDHEDEPYACVKVMSTYWTYLNFVYGIVIP